MKCSWLKLYLVIVNISQVIGWEGWVFCTNHDWLVRKIVSKTPEWHVMCRVGCYSTQLSDAMSDKNLFTLNLWKKAKTQLCWTTLSTVGDFLVCLFLCLSVCRVCSINMFQLHVNETEKTDWYHTLLQVIHFVGHHRPLKTGPQEAEFYRQNLTRVTL